MTHRSVRSRASFDRIEQLESHIGSIWRQKKAIYANIEIELTRWPSKMDERDRSLHLLKALVTARRKVMSSSTAWLQTSQSGLPEFWSIPVTWKVIWHKLLPKLQTSAQYGSISLVNMALSPLSNVIRLVCCQGPESEIWLLCNLGSLILLQDLESIRLDLSLKEPNAPKSLCLSK